MQYTIHFHSKPHGIIDDSGTHRLEYGYYKQPENSITWDLVDSPVVDAFVQAHKLITENTAESETSPRNFIDWNRYGKHVSWDSWIRDAESLNEELEYCKQSGFIDFDDSYHVDSNLDELDRISRLNKIHYAFETALEDKTIQTEAHTDFFASLERLNKLVHSLEKAPNSKFGESFYVVRHTSDHVRAKYPEITEDMYRCFENNIQNGDLYSDFFTVGKDLGHAFATNDVELVRNGEVKQQSVISGSTCFAVDKLQFGVVDADAQRTQYLEWCKSNNVELYGYDYHTPKYNLGRAPLGRINMSYSQLTKTLQQTPYVVGVQLNE